MFKKSIFEVSVIDEEKYIEHIIERLSLHYLTRATRGVTRAEYWLRQYSARVFTCFILSEHDLGFVSGASLHNVNDNVIPRDIGVLVIIDKPSTLNEYSLAHKTLRCYCAAQNYTLDIIYLQANLTYSTICPQENFFLQRHCATVEYMRRNSRLKWILFLDADIGVINPRHEIEEFIHERTDAEIELIFFERLITWEIMAGSYLAKNTPFVHDFLTEWANYVSNDAFHQDDQGPLHQVFIERFAPSHAVTNICEKLYNNSMTFWPYMDYVACARSVLGIDTRTFGSHIKLIRRGDAWTRDGHHSESAGETVAPVTSFWSDRDFMMHSWKESSKLWKRPFVNNDTFQLEKCRLSSNRSRETMFEENWRYNETLRKSDKDIEEIIDKVRKDAIDGYEKSLKNIALEEI
ncbi:hypothetical protein DdX_06739 [Ditylenchus destructor]|uniref:Uncharacterized protein n=1 Tax=Ditylenchus destructor TaxID=166010 RepID=A0AAD4N549_9BILA|nr:hypothetical protein DdX_06739 [Ditylenchus destructor]